MNGLQDRAIQRKIERDGGIERDRAFFFWGGGDFESLRLTGSNL